MNKSRAEIIEWFLTTKNKYLKKTKCKVESFKDIFYFSNGKPINAINSKCLNLAKMMGYKEIPLKFISGEHVCLMNKKLFEYEYAECLMKSIMKYPNLMNNYDGININSYKITWKNGYFYLFGEICGVYDQTLFDDKTTSDMRLLNLSENIYTYKIDKITVKSNVKLTEEMLKNIEEKKKFIIDIQNVYYFISLL